MINLLKGLWKFIKVILIIFCFLACVFFCICAVQTQEIGIKIFFAFVAIIFILPIIILLFPSWFIENIKKSKNNKSQETFIKEKISHSHINNSNICPVCGRTMKYKQKVSDGFICPICTYLTPNYKLETVSVIREYWAENQRREAIFQKTNILKDFMFCSVVIDVENKLFYIGNENDAFHIYYKFDEVDRYEIETINEKTVIKKKGGISRAIIGGALFGGIGAVVGATTAKSEAKKIGGISQIKIVLNTYAGIKTIVINNPSNSLSLFLDKCITEKSNKQISNNKTQLGSADEILKYKKLLDEGIITEEEFLSKKKQLLNL